MFSDPDQGSRRLSRPLLAVAGMIAVVGYAVCAVNVPYAAIWYPPALLVLVAAGILLRARRRRRSRSTLQLKDCTTTEIGEAWMLSTLLLNSGPSAADRLHLCHVREAYLDELALRDTEGFGRWVDDAMGGKRCRPDIYVRRELRDGDEHARRRRHQLPLGNSFRLHRPHFTSHRR